MTTEIRYVSGTHTTFGWSVLQVSYWNVDADGSKQVQDSFVIARSDDGRILRKTDIVLDRWEVTTDADDLQFFKKCFADRDEQAKQRIEEATTAWRCLTCGSSAADEDGGCLRCLKATGQRIDRGRREEQVYISAETKVKLLQHTSVLREFGIEMEEVRSLQKVTGSDVALALVIHVAYNVLFHDDSRERRVVQFLASLAIPKEEILALRLDEPEKIEAILTYPDL